MKTIDSPEEMQLFSRSVRREGRRLGFVPTMGALHAGHLSLMKAARGQSDCVAVSIFVNPLQFGPNEDFSKYPRTFEHDRRLLESEKVDVLFAPKVEAMYPAGAKTTVEVAELSERLDGRSRPGHFKGVTTVVSKLLNIVHPDKAFFGQKDAAQVAIIRRMVRDLNMDVQIVVCPIVRESDGLAMSSRNAYLDAQQRKQALVLYRTLNRMQFLADQGERNITALLDAGKQVVTDEPGAKLDYLEIVDPDSLEPVTDLNKTALVAIAAWIGPTRLIDNLLLSAPAAAL
ncbi:MAG TPA: pantoate--beta-alanine ligase [Terriglobales bacterium]|nr:pantoate--beta-alanine ligase [Terriglobales bacterium]